MTFKNNRAPLLCYFKLCASFRSHWWIQTGVRVRTHPILGQIRRFLEPCDLEIWRMTFKNNRAPLLCYFKLCASFRSHWWIQTGVRVRKHPILGQIRRFLEPCDLEIWRMTFKNNRAPLLCYFKLCASFRSHWWIQTGVRVRKHPILGQIRRFLEPCDLEIWRMTLKNNRAPLLCYFKLCASFRSHWWIQTGVRVRKHPIYGQIRRFLEPCDLEIWRMTFKNNRAPLLSIIKLYAIFHHHMWIQTGVTVRKRLSWVLTSVTLTFDLWPWPFAWTSLLSLVITFENFMMMRWWEHSQKAVTDRQTDGRKRPFIELLGRS